MAFLLPPPELQFLDDNGEPLAAGKVYTYVSGTTTDKVTYTDATEATANANPVILDSAGRANIWLNSSGLYTIKVTDADGNEISSTDAVTGGSSTITSLLSLSANLDMNGQSIITTNNTDILLVPNGTGVVSVAGTTNYGANVTSENDIPNKWYVDSVAVAAASQAEMEAASSTSKRVTPNNLQFSPFVASSWANYDADGGITINASQNIASIVDSGTGIQTVTFTTDYDDTNYMVFVVSGPNGSTATSSFVESKAVGSFVIKVNGPSLVDVDDTSFIVLGNLS